tara:strand:+ start:192 stop:530 length:339 start_codon:yes stop_codon:yes gene_type:complete
MAIKLAILHGGDQIIAEMKELMDDGTPVGYLLGSPHRVSSSQQFLMEENEESDGTVQVRLSPWVLLTSDKEIVVPRNYVVTIMEPLDSLKKMYLEKLDGTNGTNNQSNSTGE